MKDTGGNRQMIQLTRLNGSRLTVNCDLIKYAEATPDTLLTLITGEKLVVMEPCCEISQRTIEYRASVLHKAWPEASPALTAQSVFEADKQAGAHKHDSSSQ